MTRRAVGITVVLLDAAILVGLTACGITTLPALPGDATAGGIEFELECSRCHDVVLLKPFAGLIVNDLSGLDSQMNGLTLSDQQIADLEAFLATQ